MAMQSIFHNLPSPPVDEVVNIWAEHSEDKDPRKLTLIVGAFFTADSELWVSPLVKNVDKALAGDGEYEYLFPYGLESLRRAATTLILGENSLRTEQRSEHVQDTFRDTLRSVSRIFGLLLWNHQRSQLLVAVAIQTTGGTGALWMGLDFLMNALQRNVVYTSDPSWDNYVNILKVSGFRDTRMYRYWHTENKCLDFEGMCEDLNNAPENAVVILQVCAHNPTGCDPTREQWMEISNIVKKRRLFPFFDCAYLGFTSGDVDEDAWVVRYFASQGHELFCALSFSKTFALYNSRIGCLVVVTNDKKNLPPIEAHFMPIIRGILLTPPSQGARIVDRILNTPQYFDEWKESLRWRRERMVYLRKSLRARLEAKTRPGMWKCITEQSGLFAYVGLPVDVVKMLKEKYHIYVPNMPLGRINIPSLTENNIDYFVDALVETLTELK